MLHVTLLLAAADAPVAESGAATTTLIAAVVAAAAALTAAGIAAFSAARSRGQVRREQWWQRAEWAIEKALSEDRDQSDVGMAVLTKLVRQKWARSEDNEIALVVADFVTDRAGRPRRRRRR